ncbi:MAG TPA: VCBS repeat-containing protein [Pyrinomonadaceae bacterium]|nr:VCBS repeat-containing protein [Pyrinomonadaceae bacterium]
MKYNKTYGRNFLSTIFAMLLAAISISAAQVTRTASGANAAAIQATVDQFRIDLGGANNGVGGSFSTGRREINWDGVPDNFSAPNFLPVDFFNVNSPRGVVFSSKTTFGDTSAFIVSADSSNPTTTPVRFSDIDASYSGIFTTFSAERLFTARVNNVTTVNFYIPGTNIPATVNGFGVVFTDVDQVGPTYVKYYGVHGDLIGFQNALAANNGLSFVGVSFNAGERITRVEIVSGNQPLANGTIDNGTGSDLVAMDDFIYGEPRAADFHTSDFDGDGTSDVAVFRPSVGAWFVLNSGSNTFNFVTFGQNGDIPVDGDFDGDKRADITVFRPSNGAWFRLNSSNGAFSVTNFGANGDKPTPGDYDKDGKTDVAVWRPSTGNYFILRSSDSVFQSTQWGANGDIPIGASAQ